MFIDTLLYIDVTKSHWPQKTLPRDRCAMTGVPRDLCPASSAKLSARHSGAATQRNSKLCSGRPSRCRKACKDWSSVKLTSGHPQLSPEGPTWHIQKSIDLHFIHHPSWSILIILRHPSSVIHHPSSVIHHPSSCNHASIFHHSSCLHLNQEHQEASNCKAWTPRGRWDIKSSKCWSLKCCNPAKDSCTSLPEDSFLASQSSHGITLRSNCINDTENNIRRSLILSHLLMFNLVFNHYMTMCRILYDVWKMI